MACPDIISLSMLHAMCDLHHLGLHLPTHNYWKHAGCTAACSLSLYINWILLPIIGLNSERQACICMPHIRLQCNSQPRNVTSRHVTIVSMAITCTYCVRRPTGVSSKTCMAREVISANNQHRAIMKVYYSSRSNNHISWFSSEIIIIINNNNNNNNNNL